MRFGQSPGALYILENPITRRVKVGMTTNDLSLRPRVSVPSRLTRLEPSQGDLRRPLGAISSI
jgi:hypothetical protein